MRMPKPPHHVHGLLDELKLARLFFTSESLTLHLGFHLSLLPVKGLLLRLDPCESVLLTSLK